MKREKQSSVPEFEARPSNPDSDFAKGDVIKKLEILVDNKRIDREIKAKYAGETPPAQEEVDKINARMELELLEEIKESGEVFLGGLDAEGRAKTLELVKTYLESVENDELRDKLNKLETELSKK